MNSVPEKSKESAREIAQLAVLCALMFVCKEFLNMIPNVHPVTVLIIFTTLHYGWKAMYPVVGFVLLECAVFGFGIWSLMYLYIWPILVCLVMVLKNKKLLVLAAISGAFGLSFGALCEIPFIFLEGIKVAVSYWIAGIPFDLIHCVSNFVITLILLPLLEFAYIEER